METSSLFRISVLTFAILTLALPSTAAFAAQDSSPALVLGSFLNRSYADERRIALEGKLGIQVFVVEADAKGTQMFRVVLVPDASMDMSSLRARAAEMGITDAWGTQLKGNTFSSDVLAHQTPKAQQSPKAQLGEPASPSPAPIESELPKRAVSIPDQDRSTAPVPSMGPIQLSSEGPDVDITLSKFNEGEFEWQLDGRLDEGFWQSLPAYDNMLVTDPDTMGPTQHATVQRFFYTDKGLYIGVHLEQPPETLLARLSSRDEFLNRDGWGITINTSGEGLYGYWFTVNLGRRYQW